MKIEIGTLVLLLVELVNLINGYMFDYDGLLDQRRKTRNELLARLYDDLEDNAREKDLRDEWQEKEAHEGITEPSYQSRYVTEVDEPSVGQLVNKSEVSKSIEEDQQLRRNNESKNDTSARGSGIESKVSENALHGATAKGTGKGHAKKLPSYCHPPNPCPLGMTEKDGCQEFIENTAEYQKEWVVQSQRKGLCKCDEDHMYGCGESEEGADGNGSTTRGVADSELERMLESMAKKNRGENPFTDGGHKRQSLVAKKLPRFKRDAEYSSIEEALKNAKRSKEFNPYLEGSHLHTVAKKG